MRVDDAALVTVQRLSEFADEAGADGDAALLERQSRMGFVFPQGYSADNVQLMAPVGTNGKNV